MSEKDHGPRVGADPELFVQVTDNDGSRVVPICGQIGGTKEEPLNIDSVVRAIYGEPKQTTRRPMFELPGILDPRSKSADIGCYAVQEDNVMLEFNIPAVTRSDKFGDCIAKAIGAIESHILAPKNLSLKYEVSHTFQPEDLAPFSQAFQIGCLPDFNAYAEKEAREREPFNIVHFGTQRFCGGHIHVQYNKARIPPHIFVQFMDLFTLPFLSFDKQRLRRMFYGQPGIYREKPYGVEYRTLSNFWLNKKFRDSGNLTTMIENILYLARSANTDASQLSKAYTQIDWGDVQQAIKTENTKLADEIVMFARERTGLPIGTVYIA